jgi:hypothetical protein
LFAPEDNHAASGNVTAFRAQLAEWPVSLTSPALVSERTIFWPEQDRRKTNFAPGLSGAQRSAYQILQFCVRDACGVRGP